MAQSHVRLPQEQPPREQPPQAAQVPPPTVGPGEEPGATC